MNNDYNLQVNTAQEEAINTIYGPVLVISCPGSGKTTTLVRRIHHMIEEGIDPTSILMVTFSKDAAEEMKDKYVNLFGDNPGTMFSTIHAFCFRVIRVQLGYTLESVIKKEDRERFIYSKLKEAKKFGREAREMALSISTGISSVKGNGLKPEELVIEGVPKDVFVEVFNAYEAYKEKSDLIDFDDMLLLCLEVFKTDKTALSVYQSIYRFVQCDEYQDVNMAQRDILYLLTEKERNLCVVGDDDQSIYAFRGAHPDIMLAFPKDFPDAKVIKMGTNYRSTKNIVWAAGNLIKHNKARFTKEFTCSRTKPCENTDVAYVHFANKKEEMGRLVEDIKKQHGLGIPYKEMAVLFRTNVQAQYPVAALSDAGIPYYSTESIKTIYESVIFQDFKDYVALSCGKGGRKEFINVLNHPSRYLKEQYFRDCNYDLRSMMQAATYIVKSGQEGWKYENAASSIRDWMSAFGPGVVSMDSDPEVSFRKLSFIGYDKFIKDYAEYMNLDADDLMGIYDSLCEEAGKFKTIDEWFSHADDYNKKIHEEMDRKDKSGVMLTTMHLSKGLEWYVVFIIDADEGITPHKKSIGNKDGLEEERRLFYVACTRAKDLLRIYGTGARTRFLEEMSGKKNEQQNGKRIVKKPVHKTPSASITGIFIGARVLHDAFGYGYITGLKKEYVTVMFDNGSRRDFMYPYTFEKGMLQLCKDDNVL